MKIKGGTLLNVIHSRKGSFTGIATADFDTDADEFYPIAVAEIKVIHGLNPENVWVKGSNIPCRKSLCQIEAVGARD